MLHVFARMCTDSTYILAEEQLLLECGLQRRTAGVQPWCKLQSHRLTSPHPNLLSGAVGSNEVSAEPPLPHMNAATPSAAPHSSVLQTPHSIAARSLGKVPLRLQQIPSPNLRPSLLLLSPWLSHSTI